jgi:hypothetical protein
MEDVLEPTNHRFHFWSQMWFLSDQRGRWGVLAQSGPQNPRRGVTLDI